MEFWAVVATVLWTSFAAALVGTAVGVTVVNRGRRLAGLSLLLASALVQLAFSFAAGFSIGRFTAAIPVLLIGTMLAVGRGWPAVLVAISASLAIYFACSWLLTPLEFEGGLLAWLFDFWAIPLYAVLALASFGVAAARTPQASRGSSRSL